MGMKAVLRRWARSRGHVLEACPCSIGNALHHRLDLLAGAQLGQLVLACVAELGEGSKFKTLSATTVRHTVGSSGGMA